MTITLFLLYQTYPVISYLQRPATLFDHPFMDLTNKIKTFHLKTVLLLILLSAFSQNAFPQEWLNLFFPERRVLRATEGSTNVNPDEGLFFHPIELLELRYGTISYRIAFEDIYQEKRAELPLSSASNWVNEVIATFPLKTTFLKGTIAVGFSYPDISLMYHNGLDQKLDFQSHNQKGLFAYSKEVFHWLKLGLSFCGRQVARKGLYDYSLEMAFQPIPGIEIGYSRNFWNQNYRFQLSYEDIFVDLPINFICLKHRFFIRASFLNNLRLDTAYEHVALSEAASLKQQSDFYLEPKGDYLTWGYQFLYSFHQRWGFILSGKLRSLSGYGNLYSSLLKFAKISTMEFEQMNYLLGIQFKAQQCHRIRVDYEWSYFKVGSRGHIETWPFTSTIIDLFGTRGYFKSETEARLHQFNFTYQYSPDTLSNYSAEIDYLRILPTSKFSTWRPIFLVFGIKDLKQYYLKYEYANGVLVRLGFNHAFGGKFILGGSMAQYIPISAKKRKQIEQPPPTPPSEPMEKKVRGGRFYSLSLSYLF